MFTQYSRERVIDIQKLSFSAGRFALADISFTIPTAAFAVVVGVAGAGKTTLLECISGVRTPSSGNVRLYNRDVTALMPEQRSIGFVYQRGALFPHKSVIENIAYAAHNNGAVATSIVQLLGLSSLLATPTPALSGGERQLVALARALVRVRCCIDRGEHPVLLLDEPFSALDPRRRLATAEIVRELHSEWSLTTLHVTHDGAEARRADVAIVLDAGKLVQVGTPEALSTRPAREDVPLFLL